MKKGKSKNSNKKQPHVKIILFAILLVLIIAIGIGSFSGKTSKSPMNSPEVQQFFNEFEAELIEVPKKQIVKEEDTTEIITSLDEYGNKIHTGRVISKEGIVTTISSSTEEISAPLLEEDSPTEETTKEETTEEIVPFITQKGETYDGRKYLSEEESVFSETKYKEERNIFSFIKSLFSWN